MIYRDKPQTKEEAYARIARIFRPVILARLDTQIAAQAQADKSDSKNQEAA